VYPAAALATQYAENAFVAEVNPEVTPISARVDCVQRGTAAAVLSQLMERW
jgi:NAD-dependent SIR2 family protein deacetylase